MTVALNQANCPADKTKCGMRIAILAVNGKLDTIPSSLRGTKESRKIFYDDLNSKDDFALIYGTEKELNDYLKTLKVTPKDIKKETIITFQGEQLDLSTLNNDGLKNSENTSSFTLSSNGKVFNDYASYLVKGHKTNKECYYTNSCKSDLKCFETNTTTCKKAFIFYSSDGEIDVKIPIKVLNAAGNQVDYPDSTLKSTSYYTYNG